MNRFYDNVATAAQAGGYAVRLDDKPLRTPARRDLVLPTPALADLVADEWRGQGTTIAPASMPVTKLAATSTDLMPARREDAIAEVHGFAATDLLCYRADGPASLVERQDRVWQPWLDWAQRELDAGLLATRGVAPVAQPEPALRALRRHLDATGDWRLTGLHAATTLTGSLILGFAMTRGALDAAGAFAAALLDELFEIERWGEEETQQQRHATLRRDLAAAERFLRSLPS